MKSNEKGVTKDSEYFLYVPSVTAKELFFYPTIIGRFEYEPGYMIKRNHFDSFLIMLIEEGVPEINLPGKSLSAPKGSLVLLDCYNEHEYGSPNSWKSLWVHFDGPMARKYYEYISGNFGNVLFPRNYPAIHYQLQAMYMEFLEHKPVNEGRMSLYISTVLNASFTQESVASAQNNSDGLKKAIAYINENFSDNISLNELAKKASLSPFYFSRLFKKETGLTPHQYLIETRIAVAKFLLVSSAVSIREIAYETGFPDESSFCACFRKRENMTPASYRKKLGASKSL